MNHKKIQFGCGKNYLNGYINCDISNNVKTDRIVDLNNFPYPFADNSAEEIIMDNVLEHLDDVVMVMKEVNRILINGGVARIYVPYAKSDGAVEDPQHKHFFTETSMNYYIDGHDYNFYSDFRFKMLKNQPYIASKTFPRTLRKYIPFKNILKYYIWNIYDGIYFELEAVKK